MRPTDPDWKALDGAIEGDVVLPESPTYEVVRKPVNTRFHDVRPKALVLCKTPSDVAETISFANAAGLHTAVRGGGHSDTGYSSTTGVVVDVTPMSETSVSGGVASVGAGTRLGNLYDSLEEHGLTLPAGCGPSVGIAGLTLGGGIGQLGRRHGLTSDRLIGAQVVLADGSVVECDDHRDPDLFWALRGAGGGNFGIVTSFDFNTIRSPAVTCFHLRWPFTNAAAVIRAWQAWAPPAAEELSPTLLVTAPSDVDRPPQLDVFGTMLGNSADTGEVLDGLVVRTGADPSSDVRSEMSYRECKLYLAELGSKLSEEQGRLEQGHLFSKSEFLRQPLSTESIDALVGLFAAGRRRGHKRELAFLPWGGMYNRVRSDATAFVHRDELFLLKHAVVLDPMSSPPERDAARGWLSSSWGLVHPRGSGGVYPNFPDPDLEDWERAYYGSNLKRLVSVKRKYDPDNLFRFQQSIPGS